MERIRGNNFLRGTPRSFPKPFGYTNPPPIEDNFPIKKKDKIDSSKIILIGIFIFLLLLIVGAIIWLVFPSENLYGDENYEDEDDYLDDYYDEDLDEFEIIEITKNLEKECTLLELIYDTDADATCLDKSSKKMKIHLSRSSEDVRLDKINFELRKENVLEKTYSQSYGLTAGGTYIYKIPYLAEELDSIKIIPSLKEKTIEVNCSPVFINSVVDCLIEETFPLSEQNSSEIDNSSLEKNTNNTEEDNSGNIFDKFLSLFQNVPEKKITSFKIGSFEAEIEENNHIIFLTVNESISLENLSPEIKSSDNTTVTPPSNTSQDFTSPVTYTVTTSTGDFQEYVVYVIQETLVKIPEKPKNLDIILHPIVNDSSENKQVSYSVSSSSDILNCSIYLNNSLNSSSRDIKKDTLNNFNIEKIEVGSYEVFVSCVNEDLIINESNTVHFNMLEIVHPSPQPPIVTPPTINGACGTANKEFSPSVTSFGGYSFCSSGDLVSEPSFPSKNINAYSSWICKGSNGGLNATCRANVKIVTEYGGMTTGVWDNKSNSLINAKEIVKMNKNYFIVIYTREKGCGNCDRAKNYVLYENSFTSWAKENGIPLVYADIDKKSEPTNTIKNKSYKGSISTLPIMMIVSHENTLKSYLAFNYKNGVTVKCSGKSFSIIVANDNSKKSINVNNLIKILEECTRNI